MKKLLLALASAAFLALILAGAGAAYVALWYDRAGPEQTFQPLVIAPGTGSAEIAHALENAGWIDNALLFRLNTKLDDTHRRFKAGEYAYPQGASPKAIAQMLVAGESITHAITIPEGLTTREIIATLMADNRLSGLITKAIPEGTLLPDTHHIHRGDTRQSVIERMASAHAETLAALWENRAPGLPIASPEEAIILASIIEKETGVDGERRKVAGVFINRLHNNMKLQSDPTVVYAIEREKGPMNRPLYRSDWKLEHPYNTYFIVGLPPGPICHPGKAALEAALNPASHDYLYFVATGRGGHYFARTLKEHNRNIARYKAALRAP